MKDFSGHIQTQQFITWLSTRIDGSARLDFKHVDGNFATLSDARDAYQWPPKRKTVPTPTGALELEANASLAANQRVLDRLGQGCAIVLPRPQSTRCCWLSGSRLFCFGAVSRAIAMAVAMRDGSTIACKPRIWR